ncbi:MAG: hypothetical protein LC776_08150 [Acidobacteria bacterium]|nr:hypothetical protein [Acidobacteriota bacterium]
MSKRLLGIAGSVALSVAAAGLVVAQDPQSPTTQTTTTVTRQTTKSVQNADGTSTVIEYPADKEVTVELTPSTMIPGAKGTAKIMRSGTETTINLDVSGLTGDATSYNLYAVDPAGTVTMLGPVAINNGTGSLSVKTPLDKFMLVLSPEANLTTVGTDTKVALRSAVPEGFAVVPMSSHNRAGRSSSAPVGERVRAATTPGATPAYNVPMLGIPSFRRGTDTHMRINFTGALTGSRANVFILPRKDGPTQIKMRFHELKDAPAGQRLVVWAVGPDKKFHRLGQVINTGRRNEAQIQTETDLQDFGLFITAEDVGEAPSPSGAVIATIVQQSSR